MLDTKAATVHLKLEPTLRNSVLATLRGRGTTMQTFFKGVAELIVQDAALLEMLESKRHALREGREVVHS